MIGLSHIVLQIGLCARIERLPDTATFAARVRLTDKSGVKRFEKTFRVERGDEDTQAVEFDAPWGIYHLDVATKQGCSFSSYVSLLPGYDRSIAAALRSHRMPAAVPMLLNGTAPQSFSYANPTFVIFDTATTACNKPVSTPLPSHITVENDRDAYYATFYPAPAPQPGVTPVMALRLQTPTHQYHYVRIPIPLRWSSWPSSVGFDVTQNLIENLAGKPVDTLLCPKLWETTTH